MSETSVEINTANLERALRIFPKELKYQIGDGMDHISRKFLSLFRQTRLQGPPGVKGRPHGIFTQFSRASLVSQDIEGMGMVIFSGSKIAKLQEEGGVVNASAGALIVPLSMRPEMFVGGQYPGRVKAQYKEPRSRKDIIELLLNGKRFLAKVKKRSREILPLFIMKNKIKIRPRLGFYQTWDSMQDVRINILNKSIEDTLNKTK